MHIKRSPSVFTRHSSNILFPTMMYFQHVVLVGGFASSDWLFSKVHELLTPWNKHRSSRKPRVSILQYLNNTTIQKSFFRNKAVSDGAISFYLDHFVSTRVSKFTVPLSISHTAVGLKTRSPLLLGLGGFVGHSVLSYPK